MTLEDRITKLELSNRRSRWIIALLLVVGAGGATMGFTRDDVQEKLRVQEIELVYPNGMLAGSLAARKESAGLTLFGKDGGTVTMSAGGAYARLLLSGPKSDISARVLPNGSFISVDDEHAKAIWSAP